MSWADNSIVRPAHELNALRGGRTILLSAQLVASWADNRFVHVSFSRNPQKNCNKPIVSDIQSHENNVCDRFVSLEQNSSQLSWETMTYFQPSPLRGSGWKCHCFSLKLRWILFSRDKTDANVLFWPRIADTMGLWSILDADWITNERCTNFMSLHSDH